MNSKLRLSGAFAMPAALFLAVTAATGQVREPGSGPAAGSPNEDQYLIMFRAGTPANERAQAVSRGGGLLRYNLDVINGVAARIPNFNALTALRRNAAVVSIVPDRVVEAFQGKKPGGGGGGGGSSQAIPEGVKRVGAPRLGSDGTGIGVAIVDSGIDLSHADLAVGAVKFDSFGGTCQDGNGHGTHVAGTVAALDNTIDVLGVAPKATPYCVRVLDNSGSGSDATVIAGLNWVYQNRASIRVVNMSLGRPRSTDDDDAPIRSAIQGLTNEGVIVVVAAGNDATKEVKDMVPARFPEVIAVASTAAKSGTNACRNLSSPIAADTASYFTTDGALSAENVGVTISAPGEDQENVSRPCLISSVGVLSLRAGGGTTRMSGTSMASPHVAGIVARILQKSIASGVEGVRSHLRTTASQTGTAPLNSPTSSYTFDGEREGIAQAP
jgi:subtilisin